MNPFSAHLQADEGSIKSNFPIAGGVKFVPP